MTVPFKIYGFGDNHAFMIPLDDADLGVFDVFGCDHRLLRWRSPRMVLCDPVRNDRGDRSRWRRGLVIPDIIDRSGPYSSTLAINPRAMTALGHIIKDDADVYSLDCDPPFVVTHITRTLPCGFDMVRSDVKYYDDGRPYIFGKRVLNDTDPPGSWPALFQVKDLGLGNALYGPYVNEEFKRAYDAAGLIGLTFEPIEVSPRE